MQHVGINIFFKWNILMSKRRKSLFGALAFAVGLTVSAGEPPQAINVGGSAFTDSQGIGYEADHYFLSGGTASTSAPIENTDDDALYQTERYGVFAYDLPVENGTYKVTLKYAEIYYNDPSSRLFRTEIEGEIDPVLYDILSAANGKNMAYDVEYTATVTDGNLDIDFLLGPQDLPKLSAILVTPVADEKPDSYALYTGPNLGHALLTAEDGKVYQDTLQDHVVSEGFTFNQGTGLVISNTEDDRVYQYSVNSSESFELGLPIEDGLYRVVLKFSENDYSSVNAVGDRVFNLSLEGDKVPQSFDIFEMAGKYNALDVAYDVEIVDGELNIKLDKDASSLSAGPMLNALSVEPLASSYAINVGGVGYVDASGLTYQADTNFEGGHVASTSSPIAKTEDDALYQSERYGEFNYDLPIADGEYTVTLKFAENYWNNRGERLFRVKNEGQVDIMPLTIFSSAGGKNIAYDRVYDVNVSDGELNVEMMLGRVDLPKLSAILVEPKPTVIDFYAINCGGDAYTDLNGITYEGDDADHYEGTSSTYVSSAPIASTEDDTLYQSQVLGTPGQFKYVLPIEDGTYTVTFKMAQLDSVPGFSYFSTNAEGQSHTHFMPGANNAYDYKMYGVTVTDGVLDIEFDANSGGGHPYVSAILVEKE
jgi:hypothetical protein